MRRTVARHPPGSVLCWRRQVWSVQLLSSRCSYHVHLSMRGRCRTRPAIPPRQPSRDREAIYFWLSELAAGGGWGGGEPAGFGRSLDSHLVSICSLGQQIFCKKLGWNTFCRSRQKGYFCSYKKTLFERATCYSPCDWPKLE